MKKIIFILTIISLINTGCSNKRIYYYELTIRNAGSEDLLFVSVVTGKTNNGFGIIDHGAPDKGKTAAGCAISFDGATKITWEDENDKVYEFDLKLKDYYPQRNQIKGFIFTYQGDNKWEIKTK